MRQPSFFQNGIRLSHIFIFLELIASGFGLAVPAIAREIPETYSPQPNFATNDFTDFFNDNILGSEWTTHLGTWVESGGILMQTSASLGDPKKVILSNSGIDFSSNCEVRIIAKVRVDSWEDGDSARAGVSLFTDPTTGYGYSLLFHGDHSTIQFLDDYVAWGPSYTFSWSTGQWYYFSLKIVNGVIHGVVWLDGTTPPSTFPYEWARSGRTGYPALVGGGVTSFSPGSSTASFDNLAVMSSNCTIPTSTPIPTATATPPSQSNKVYLPLVSK